ncbi:MAG: galactokinase [Planctomycetota bacterium]|jgi:galactokinase
MQEDKKAFEILKDIAANNNIEITGGRVRRTSSRFCFGVEHGDYNGTELFGVGTDRFIWFAYKPNGTDRIRLFSGNFPNDGVIDFEIGHTPPPLSAENAQSWARFPYGVDYILSEAGYKISEGIDGVVYGNIPGGGMSRSASLTLNLILSLLDANGIEVDDQLQIVDMAQAVENKYIGSPCGQLDQIMILFAKEGMGTHYNPSDRTIKYVPFGPCREDWRIVVMDTGTVRPGLEKSTYKVRRAQCEELVILSQQKGFAISCLADIEDQALYDQIYEAFVDTKPDLCGRMRYIFGAQQRFYRMLGAWKAGDIHTVGKIFREDGLGLRNDYEISGPELEAMCDIAREVPGVLGERMLGGGDKGASGAIALADAVESLKAAIGNQYPYKYPEFADTYAVHVCKVVDGVKVFDNL